MEALGFNSQTLVIRRPLNPIQPPQKSQSTENIKSAPLLLLHSHTWHFLIFAALSDRCGDKAHVKVKASSLLISLDIFLYRGCQWVPGI